MGGQYDSSNPKHVDNKNKKADSEEYKDIEGLKFVMSDKRGRRWMWNHLADCGIYEISFTGNSTTFFNEGRRSAGLKLLSDLHEHCLPEYQRMQRENLNKTSNDDV